MDGNNMWQQEINQPNRPVQEQMNPYPGQEQSTYLYYQPAGNPMTAQAIPMDAGKKKIGGKGPVIAIVLIVLALLLGGGALLLYQFMFNTPEARLMKGIANFAQEMSAYGVDWQEEIGLTELIQNMQEKNCSSIEAKLNATLPELETIGIDYLQNYDGNNQLMEAELAFSFFNIKLLEAKLAADEEYLYVSVPDIVDEWYSLHTETLGADYQGSIWEEVTGMTLPEEYGFSVFEERLPLTQAENTEFQEKWEELIEEYIPRFAENSTIEDSGDAVEIERDGKTIRCEGVLVTIEKEVINDFSEEFFELYEAYSEEEGITFSGEVKTDVKLCFYMDNKNRIVNISTPEKIKFSDSKLEAIEFSLIFSGVENVFDEISGNGEIEVTDEVGEDIAFEIEHSAETTDSTLEEEWILTMEGESGKEVVIEYTSAIDLEDLEMEGTLVNTSGDAVLELSYKGACTDVEKGESLTVEIDEFLVIHNDKEMYKMTGSIDLGMLEEEIEMPDDAVDLMGITEGGVMDIVTGFKDYVEKYEKWLYY